MKSDSGGARPDQPKHTRPYGAWDSPLAAALVAASGMGSSALPREIKTVGETVYWIQFTPGDPARYVIMKRTPDGAIDEVTPAGFSARSRVHEYGGGVYEAAEGVVFFVNDADQRIYRQDTHGDPRAISPPGEPGSLRFADLTLSPDGVWLAAVCERHEEGGEIVNELVLLPSDGSGSMHNLKGGADFYAAPRFHPHGSKLAWLAWNHPNMPWDGCELWSAPFEDGMLGPASHIAGGDSESIYQPEWSPSGVLTFVSDRTGWWNLYQADSRSNVEAITIMEVEFGQPAWLFAFRNYAFLSNGDLAAVFKERGQPSLGLVHPVKGSLERIPTPYTCFELPTIAADSRDGIWFFAGSPSHPPALIRADPGTGECELVHAPINAEVPGGLISVPEHIEFRSADGRTAYAYLYRPCNPYFQAPTGTLPPLIVTAHGGPISCARPYLDPEILYWTSRGFAFLDVDYAGSTGYGTVYRRSLDGQWGVADVEDCVFGAQHLVHEGVVDRDRLLIRGGSAGGFVVLAALTFHGTFSAGASYYGIGDLMLLADHTHKFEARSMERLIGPLPEAADRYQARSPLAHRSRLQKPVILFQGLEDAVVPTSQSDAIAGALAEKNIPYAYLRFEGEGHGFRNAQTIIDSLEAELEFYQRVLEIPTESATHKLYIHNL